MHDPGHDRVYTYEYDEQVCDCIGVLRCEILEDIDGGAQSVDAIINGCGAGGGCGSCHSEIARLLMVKSIGDGQIEGDWRTVLDQVLSPLAKGISGRVELVEASAYDVVLKVYGNMEQKQTIALWAEILIEPLLPDGAYLEVE